MATGQLLSSQTAFALTPRMHLHLVGIGGSGISAIARVLLGRGFIVSGSDEQGNHLTEALRGAGATVYEGHAAAHVLGADALVVSSAIPASNPEIVAAHEAGIPVLKRANFLGHLMQGKRGIAVAGSHGKTTTTGLIAQIFMEAALDPTIIIGGVLPSLGTNGRFGEGVHFIIEADEYDHMFLGLKPTVAVITSIEHDHPDVFPTMSDYVGAFHAFVDLLPANGHLVACVDDAGVRGLLASRATNAWQQTTYSLDASKTADFRALDLRPNHVGGSDFLVEKRGAILGVARLRVPGKHNVQNALAATIVALDAGLSFNTIRKGLATFEGIGRRFEQVGSVAGVTVIDDYAHHPTAIQATLAAARQQYANRRLWVVWQPHTYSRTKALLAAFATSFKLADGVIVLDIYASREKETLGINTAVVVEAMAHENVVHISKRRDAATYLLARVEAEDVILTLGAGDGNDVGRWVLRELEKRKGFNL